MVHEIYFSFDKNAVTCKKEAPLPCPHTDQEEALQGEDDHLHLNL